MEISSCDAFKKVFAYQSKSRHFSKDYVKLNWIKPLLYFPVLGQVIQGIAFIAPAKIDLKNPEHQALLARAIIVFTGLNPFLAIVDAIATAMLHCDNKYKTEVR